jgi:hypothetical protein
MKRRMRQCVVSRPVPHAPLTTGKLETTLTEVRFGQLVPADLSADEHFHSTVRNRDVIPGGD